MQNLPQAENRRLAALRAHESLLALRPQLGNARAYYWEPAKLRQTDPIATELRAARLNARLYPAVIEYTDERRLQDLGFILAPSQWQAELEDRLFEIELSSGKPQIFEVIAEANGLLLLHRRTK